LPQAQGTVSVGTFLVSCLLQIGQGLVIWYVIAVFSVRANNLSMIEHVGCHSNLPSRASLTKTDECQRLLQQLWYEQGIQAVLTAH
jgi:hypothetical protein